MLDLIRVKGECIDGQYRISEYLSEGSFGWVFKAEHEVLGKTNGSVVAVKILKGDPDEEEAVLREVRMLRACQHENVITVHASGRNHGGRFKDKFFITMELADHSLQARLKQGPLSIDEVHKLALHVCTGLAHLHNANMVHRDLKPANVLSVGGVWKLSDFGLARAAGHLRTQSRLGGTPDYCPPEGLSENLAPSFDMWSLGCVLHECLTGTLPRVARGKKAEGSEVAVPEPFKTIISACLRQAPEKRITAEQCVAMLDPSATPLHFRVDDSDSDCFLCSHDSDCARSLISGTVTTIRKVGTEFECVIHSAEDLDAVSLYLSETWAVELGQRLHDDWARFSRREHPVTLSAFHLVACKNGYRATDESLVVLDPDWLVTATDLKDVHACERVRLVRRHKVFRTSKAIVLGNVVNDLLPDVWNEGGADRDRQERELAARAREIAQCSGVRLQWLRSDVVEHLARLSGWAEKWQRNKPSLHTETSVIAPDMGLKGRIDALWFRDGERVALGELKSGNRRAEDELQLSSYGLMLVSRGEVSRDIRTLLMYSKPFKDGDAKVEKSVALVPQRFREAIIARNKVLLVDSALQAPHNASHCQSCWDDDKDVCTVLTRLCEHPDTRPVPMQKALETRVRDRVAGLGPSERSFFREHQARVLEELRAVKSQHALLWSRTPQQRERDGLALHFRAVVPLGANGTRRRYGLVAGSGANHSQIQVESRLTLSGLEGPTRGRIIMAVAVQADGDGIQVECDEELPFSEGWASADIDDKLVEREFTALFEWIVTPSAQRDVVVHGRPPTLDAAPKGWKMPAVDDLNPQQQRAIELSVRTRDYLLVLGPPGAGKTTLLRGLVQAQLALGRRVLLSANSNRAVDQVVRTLIKGGMQRDVLRLGRLHSMADDVRGCGLEACYDSDAPLEAQVDAIRLACASKRIVASTASALATGEFEGLLGRFDLVVVDEATQVSLALSLGPLRYADRFVLVGDPNQLAPIRVSRGQGQSSEPSLFEVLAERVREAGAEGLVELKDQYRMNAEICRIPSELWYQQTLRPGSDAVAKARLDLRVTKVPANVREALNPKQPVVFIDVPSEFHGPRMNLAEARWVGAIVSALHASDPLLLDKTRAEDRLGVLAPFRAQVACIRHELARCLPSEIENRHWVDTVDRFQGGERDIMLISLVGSREDRVPDHLRDVRRLNVAVSRARHKLILIGDHDFLARDPLYAQLFAVMAAVDPQYRIRAEAL